MSRRGEESPDVVHDVSSGGGLYYYPPDYERDSQPAEDCPKIHVASHRRPDSSYSPENQC